MIQRLATLLLIGSWWAAAAAAQATAPVERPGMHADPEKIQAHVKALAGDRLERRGTGERSGDLAADYLARQFASYGLQPAGDNGTYFQEVPMIGVQTLEGTSFAVVTANLETLTLRNLEDFVVSNSTQTESAYIDAPVVFAGYGIQAPQYGWDDYKEASLDGKVALVLANTPPSGDSKLFDGKASTDYGGWRYKFAETARRGAVATLIIHGADFGGYGWELVRNLWGKERAYLKGDTAPKLRAASWLRSEAAQKLVALSGLDLEKLAEEARSRDFRPIELPLRLQAHVASQLRSFVARNVLAAKPARGARSQEAIVYTAHYDHLGTDLALKGHDIYSGAVDSATGCGVLLEVARAWSQAPSAPPRTILFAALTGEDQGLLGSEYLAGHAPVPAGNIALVLNYGALAPIGDTAEVEVSGAERTTFYPVVEAKAKTLGLTIRTDSRPAEGSYYRSSPFSLARVGIPAFSIAEGLKFKGHDAARGDAHERDDREHRRYRPTDEHRDGMDFKGDARLATFGYELGMEAASEPRLIGWLPGDEFEVARRQSQIVARRALVQPSPRKTKSHRG